jgi:copper chaperone CopZ
MDFLKLTKSAIFVVFCVVLFGSVEVFAAEETKYIASMSGVECTACKKTIAKAIAKLDGVKTIRIVKKDKKNHQLEIFTDGSHELTKADAVKALEKAKHYKILSWVKG